MYVIIHVRDIQHALTYSLNKNVLIRFRRITIFYPMTHTLIIILFPVNLALLAPIIPHYVVQIWTDARLLWSSILCDDLMIYLADITYTHLELLFRPSFSLSEKEVVTLSTEGIVGDIFCSLTDSVSYKTKIPSWNLNYALLTEERSRIGFVTFSLSCDVVWPTFIGQFIGIATC